MVSGSDLRGALQELDGIRPLRTDAEYGWRPGSSPDEAEQAVEIVRRVLRLAAQNLREHRPGITARITPSG